MPILRPRQRRDLVLLAVCIHHCSQETGRNAHPTGTRTAYALTNDKEYFAEISEAWWGRNDFFPFTRDQLKTHDPAGFEVLKEVWLEPVPPREK